MTPLQRIRELRLKHAELVQELLRFDTCMTFATTPAELRRCKALSWNMHGQIARCNKSIDKIRRDLRQGQRAENHSYNALIRPTSDELYRLFEETLDRRRLQ